VQQWIQNFVWIENTQKFGLLTVKWSILCGFKGNDDLQVTNILQLEKKVYLLCLALKFAYDKMTWAKLTHIRFLNSISIKDICFLIIINLEWYLGCI